MDFPVEARSTSSCVCSNTSRPRLIASRRLPYAAVELLTRSPLLPLVPLGTRPTPTPPTSVPPGSVEVVGSRRLREGPKEEKCRFNVGSIGSQSVRLSFSATSL